MKKEDDINKIKKILREEGIEECELNNQVDKIFDLANILFDKWLISQKQNYEKR